MTETTFAPRARTGRRPSFGLFLHNGKTGERRFFDADCPAFRRKSESENKTENHIEQQRPQPFRGSSLQRSLQADRPSNRARYFQAHCHARALRHWYPRLVCVLCGGCLCRDCRSRHPTFSSHRGRAGVFDRRDGNIPLGPRASQRLSGGAVNGSTQSRRGAVARVLVWAGILVATAVFWVAVAFGLAAWMR